jgi:hypothetical protein
VGQRPDDERYTSLIDMAGQFNGVRANSRVFASNTRQHMALPYENDGMMVIADKLEVPAYPTHHAFGQLATPAKAPAGYPAHVAVSHRGRLLQLRAEIQARH